MKLGEIAVHIGNYNLTKFQMKNKKDLLIACFSVQNFKVSVELWKSYIVMTSNGWCWIKKYFSQKKIFWLLISFDVWLACHFYNLLFAYCKSFFKRRKQATSWNCFFEKVSRHFQWFNFCPLFISLLDSTSQQTVDSFLFVLLI